MRPIYALGLLVVAAAGCAKAGPLDDFNKQPDGGGIQHVDADNSNPGVDAPPPIDAAPIPDAPPGMVQVTLSQTTKNDIVAGNSIACPATDVGTSHNTYYRVFDLAAAGITTEFDVSTVSFQVEDCESVNADGAPVAVRVGTYSGTVGTTLVASDITIIQSNNAVQIPEVDEDSTASPPTTPGTLVNAPITAAIPEDSQLVVEIDAPDGNDQYQLYLASNPEGQSATGFVSSPSCKPPGNTPTDVNTLGAPTQVDFLITVTGTHQ